MQLGESLGGLVIFALLLAWRGRKREHGELFGALIVLYGVLRFVLEIWRDDPRGALLGLSTSQLIAVVLVPVGAWLIVRSRLRGRARDVAA